MNKRRMFLALLGMAGVMAIFLVRLLWLQTIAQTRLAAGKPDLVRQSVLQREQRLQLDSGRGDFYDRWGKPLTGEAYPALLVFPVMASEDSGSLAEQERLCRILGADMAEWNEFRRALDNPRFWSGVDSDQPVRLTESMIGDIEGLHLDGLAIVPYERRYASPYLAAHLLGYISQDPDRVATEFSPMVKAGRISLDSPIGAAGLEKTFEPLLRGLGGTYISLYTDSLSRPIPGIGYRLHAPDNPYYPLQIITTLDAELQAELEKLADRSGLKEGAIVVLDAKTADIAGMVSRPSFSPEQVNPQQKGWSNQALLEASPGSIFKTVVAAAALEHNAALPDETFECPGSWGKYHFTCWKKEGHGTLTFRQAYAQSCNIVFGQIMLRLKPGQLEETARKLGIGLPSGWEGKLLHFSRFKQLDKEETGKIWADPSIQNDEGARLQTAIGQRDVRMTPLQAANMVATLLNGGKAQSVRAVKEVRYATGRQLAEFRQQPLASGESGVSGKTAGILLEWMKDVVGEGTGTALNGAAWELAGKSGTAQVPAAGGGELYNQWFVGYGPAKTPRYAVSVVSLRQQASGSEAVGLFRQVMELLARFEEEGLGKG